MGFDVESYFSGLLNGISIVYYEGNIDSDIINKVLDTVEEKLGKENEQSKLRKRVYNVLVESLQNLYHHVDKVPEDFKDQTYDKYGLLAINKVKGGYKIVTGNFIRSENVEKLEEKIKRINRSSHEEITELYKFILNHQRISSKGGGGLGLVDIARKTGNKLEYTFKEYNDKLSFFYLNILVGETKLSTQTETNLKKANMEPIIIEGTPKTPTIKFDATEGVFEIKGRSIPENSVEFYKPLVDWLDSYKESPLGKTVVNIKLEYFNTSSSKCILDVFKKLEAIHKAKNDVEVNWYYEEDDEDMLEAGEDYESIIRVPFKMIEITD
ncbi:MAG: SiaC family regulatory phosphoprotein [Bacteroidales bacterium]